MRMEAIMGDIKYVQLAAGDFLSDPDFQMMTAEERGIYCTLIFYLYNNNGKIENDPERIKYLSNCGDTFDKSWLKIRKKFFVKNSKICHKRVLKELAKAKKYIQAQKDAGLKGAKKRWGSDGNPNSNPNSNANGDPINDPNGESIAKKKKKKESKKKISKVKRFIPPSLEDVKKYIRENPELNNVNPETFWKGFNDADPPWHDTRGNPVRNWKLKLRTWSSYGNRSNQTVGGDGSVHKLRV